MFEILLFKHLHCDYNTKYGTQINIFDKSLQNTQQLLK